MEPRYFDQYPFIAHTHDTKRFPCSAQTDTWRFGNPVLVLARKTCCLQTCFPQPQNVCQCGGDPGVCFSGFAGGEKFWLLCMCGLSGRLMLWNWPRPQYWLKGSCLDLDALALCSNGFSCCGSCACSCADVDACGLCCFLSSCSECSKR